MKQLNKNETKQVAGASLIYSGAVINVPSTGIPDEDFRNIEYAFQMELDGKWSEKDALDYILGCGSFQYLETYLINSDLATIS